MRHAGRWAAGVATAVLTAVIGAVAVQWLAPADPQTPPLGHTSPSPSAAAATNSPAASLPPAPSPSPSLAEPPFTVGVSYTQDPQNGWVSAVPENSMAARPTSWNDWPAWAAANPTVPAEAQSAFFMIQGTSEAQVTLTGLKIRVTRRAQALAGTRYGVPGGGDTAYRWINVDLDRDPPSQTSEVFDTGAAGVPDYERKPIRFPYKVSISDAETFLIIAHAQRCDCSWHAELEWMSQGRSGTVLIDDHGKEFHLTGVAGVVRDCRTPTDGTAERCVDS